MSNSAKELTKSEKFRKHLVEAKNTSESYVVLAIYKNTDIYFDSNLSADDLHDPLWKFYFGVAENLIKDGKKVLDDITIGLFVGKSNALQEAYDKFGGYSTISNGVSFVQEENFDSYLIDVKKSNVILKLHDLGFPVMDRYDIYKNMEIDRIEEAFNGVINTIFADVDVDEQVEDLSDGLMKVVKDADEGVFRGFPYTSGLLTEFTNGQALGNLTMLSANSGMGKTFMVVAQLLPNVIEFEEKLVIMANEEDSQKWKREMITWAVNNMSDGNFDKYRFNQGDFTKDELRDLSNGVKWLEDKIKKGIITFINFSNFSMKKAIKVIKKQSSINDVDYFVLDTLKLDNDALNNDSQFWLSLQQNVVKLFDTIKPKGLNKHIFVTYQLGKSAMTTRFLNQNSLGMSKNVVDTASTVMLMRHALESEKNGGKNKVPVKTKTGTKYMQEDKQYFILFFGKNRANKGNRQLVFEVDMGRNIMKDFGTCIIPEDF